MKDEVKTSKCEKSNIIKSSDVIHKVEQDDEANWQDEHDLETMTS